MAVIVFDLTNKASFTNCDKWVEDVKNERGNDAVVVIVGNKIDKTEERAVTAEEAQEKAKKAFDILEETGAQGRETLGEWAKRKKDEKKAAEQQTVPETKQVSTPESSAIPIAIATEMKGRTNYDKEENIYLRQSDRDRLRALEAKKSNKTITEEEKTEMTNLKAKRRRNKAAGKTYT